MLAPDCSLVADDASSAIKAADETVGYSARDVRVVGATCLSIGSHWLVLPSH